MYTILITFKPEKNIPGGQRSLKRLQLLASSNTLPTVLFLHENGPFFLELKHLMHINSHSGSRRIEKNDQTWCRTCASSAIADYFQNFDIFPYWVKIVLGSLPEIPCSWEPGVLHAYFHAYVAVFKALKLGGTLRRISRNPFSKSTCEYFCVFFDFRTGEITVDGFGNFAFF